MTTTCPGNGCNAEVLEAFLESTGASFRLNPLRARSGSGKYAVWTAGGVLRVRLITEARPLEATETPYSKHKCRSGQLKELSDAQAKAAAEGRRRQHRPVRRGPFNGTVGVRAARRGGER